MCSSLYWQVGQSWFREKLSPANREQRLSRWADFAKNCLPRIGSKVLPRFREKYRARGRQKNGVQHATAIYPIPRYTRPRYIGLTLYSVTRPQWVKPCNTKFIKWNIKIYLNLSSLNTELVQVIKIIPHERRGPIHSALSIAIHAPLLLMAWTHKEPWHQ